MKVNVVYPQKNLRRDLRRLAIYVAVRLFPLAAIVSLVVNILYGTSWWSAIVIWSLWGLWQLIFSPTLVEHNRTSIAAKTTINITILIVIIYLVYPDWPGIEVAALVVGFGLVTSATLFFSNIARQKQNVFPLIIFSLIAIVFAAVSLIFRKDEPLGWAMIVAISLALAIILSTIIILRINYFKELKKRFIL
ncbi:MAG: hypothetical protein WCY90_00805 [Bacilli bacterium]